MLAVDGWGVMPRAYGITNASPYASAPAVGASGDTYWNTTGKVLYVSDGAAWQRSPAIRQSATTACVETNMTGATPVTFATLTLTVSGGPVVIMGELVGSLHDTTGGATNKWVELDLYRGAGILRKWLVPVLNPNTMLVGMAFPVHYVETPSAGSVTYALKVFTDPNVTIRTDLFAGASRAGYLTAVEYA